MTVMENLELGAFIRKDKDGIAKDLKMVFERFPRLEERINQQAGTRYLRVLYLVGNNRCSLWGEL